MKVYKVTVRADMKHGAVPEFRTTLVQARTFGSIVPAIESTFEELLGEEGYPRTDIQALNVLKLKYLGTL